MAKKQKYLVTHKGCSLNSRGDQSFEVGSVQSLTDEQAAKFVNKVRLADTVVIDDGDGDKRADKAEKALDAAEAEIVKLNKSLADAIKIVEKQADDIGGLNKSLADGVKRAEKAEKALAKVAPPTPKA